MHCSSDPQWLHCMLVLDHCGLQLLSPALMGHQVQQMQSPPHQQIDPWVVFLACDAEVKK